jgi:hypothetical protein
MDQFEVKSLFGGHVGMFSITNVTLWMALAVAAVSRSSSCAMRCFWSSSVTGAILTRILSGLLRPRGTRVNYKYCDRMTDLSN